MPLPPLRLLHQRRSRERLWVVHAFLPGPSRGPATIALTILPERNNGARDAALSILIPPKFNKAFVLVPDRPAGIDQGPADGFNGSGVDADDIRREAFIGTEESNASTSLRGR